MLKSIFALNRFYKGCNKMTPSIIVWSVSKNILRVTAL